MSTDNASTIVGSMAWGDELRAFRAAADARRCEREPCSRSSPDRVLACA